MEKIDFENINKRHAEESTEFIEVLKEKCTGCGKCAIICPMELYSIEDGKAVLNQNYRKECLECGHCWVMCPQDAIKFDYPDGGTGVIYMNG
ncbi:MAG: indolepyruvate ferredoxin oxidoreductase subunit alpha [Candidatus Helarchaeota archaeon]